MSLGKLLQKNNISYLMVFGIYISLVFGASVALVSQTTYAATPTTSVSGVFCNNNAEYNPESGLTEEDFCKDKGGVKPSTGTTSGSGGTQQCDITSYNNVGSKGCVTEVEVIDDAESNAQYQCGKGGKAIKITFNIGCRGDANGEDVSPIEDMLFALLRFITAGVGIVTVGSVIVGGIQYSASQGNPQAMQAAIKRIQASIGALLLFGFAYALLNWLIPGGILR